MSSRYYAIDYMRLVLAAFVVIGHSHIGRPDINPATLIVGNSVLRTAVPLFAITAGFFLMRRIEQGREWPWVKRMVVLYAIWTAIYIAAFQLVGPPQYLHPIPVLLGFWHLWFLLGLAVGALMLRFFYRLGMRALVMSGLFFMIAGLLLQYAQIFSGRYIYLEFYRNGIFFLYPYMVFGFLVARAAADRGEGARVGPSSGVLLAIATFGFALSIAENIFTTGIMRSERLLEISAGLYLLSTSVFLLVLRMRAPACSLQIGAIASGIYILHLLFLHLMFQAGFGGPWLYAFLAFFGPGLLIYILTRPGRSPRWIGQFF